jgi:hypothetical protein
MKQFIAYVKMIQLYFILYYRKNLRVTVSIKHLTKLLIQTKLSGLFLDGHI